MTTETTPVDPATNIATLGEIPIAWFPLSVATRLERALADVFGEARAEQLKMAASRDTARDLIAAVGVQRGVAAGVARFALARQLFASLGEGRFVLETVGERRVASATSVFGGTSTATPTAGYAAGWIAASLELALTRPPNTIAARQRDSAGEPGLAAFDFQRDEGAAGFRTPALSTVRVAGEPGGDSEGVHRALVGRARTLLDAHAVDPQGVREVIGVRLSARPASYWARVVELAFADLSRNEASVGDALHSLLVEATARGIVEAFVAVALSDEWELYCGGRAHHPSQLAAGVCALAGALGWGRVIPESIDAGGVALRSGTLVDSPRFAAVEAVDRRGCYLLEGLALAIARACDRLDLSLDDPPSPERLAQVGRAGQWDVAMRRAIESGESCDVVLAARS